MGTRDRFGAVALGSLRVVLGVLVGVALVGILGIALTSSRPALADPVPFGPGHDATAESAEVVQVTEESSAKRVASSENSALKVLVEKYGKECISSGSVTVSFPRSIGRDLDEKINAADLKGSGWITEGGTWVGDVDSAIDAFGAVEAFEDEEEIWLLLDTEIGLVARLMHPIESESGKTTWRLLDQATKCGSADPASDDD